ncbi:glycerate kinase [Demequina sp.]|uniref:glycerate kinase n=1 Tax=Demequina sp. TaxID=2050685 RepID=UPI003D0A3427
MRAVMGVERWPGVDTVRDVGRIAASAWGEVSDATLEVFAVGDGGPRTADSFPPDRMSVGGVQAVPTPAGLLLSPKGADQRWNPQDLMAALLGLAAAADEIQGAVIVPLGDATPAGDALEVWGAAPAATRLQLAKLSLRVLVTSDRPLLGFHGMSASLRNGRESDAALAVASQDQEARWREIAATGDAIASRGTLLGPNRLSDAPGSGAAGGLAYCLAALGATLTRATDYLAEAVGLSDAVAGADVVLAVGGPLSPATLDHGLATTAARLAARHALPAVAITTDLSVGRRDVMAAGLSGTHEGNPGPEGLADVVRRVAQTWAPRR